MVRIYCKLAAGIAEWKRCPRADPFCDHFHLIFGTSTGAIIAALLSLGCKVEDNGRNSLMHADRHLNGNDDVNLTSEIWGTCSCALFRKRGK